MRFHRTVLAAGALSFSIELLQWVFGTGVSDLDDLLFNVCGAALGYGLYRVISAGKRVRP